MYKCVFKCFLWHIESVLRIVSEYFPASSYQAFFKLSVKKKELFDKIGFKIILII